MALEAYWVIHYRKDPETATNITKEVIQLCGGEDPLVKCTRISEGLRGGGGGLIQIMKTLND